MEQHQNTERRIRPILVWPNSACW